MSTYEIEQQMDYVSLNGEFYIVDGNVTEEKIVIWQGYQGSAHSKIACKILQ